MTITTITPTRLSIARETRVVIASGVTISATSNLNTLFESGTGNNVSAIFKNITISPPETARDLQSFLGTDTNAFQNQMLEAKPPGLATFTGTAILDEDEALDGFLDNSGTAITDGYTRYQLGNNQSEHTDILVNISGTTASVSGALNIALIDAEITKWGDVRISGPDSHWEQDITAVTLAKNFYWEYKN